MMRVLAALLLLASLLSSQERKGKSPKPPDVLVLEIKVLREPGHITLDGRVSIGAERPLRGLVLFFEFLAPGGAMLSRQRTQIAEESMDPAEEAPFHVQTVHVARAVHIRLEAEDGEGRPLRIDKPGPYVIE